MRVIVIGTLGGVLALTQTRQIIAQLKEQWPEAEFRVRAVSAREEYPSKPGMPILEQALLAGEVDIAVHTLDKFTPLPNLKIASTLKRLDPRDVLVGREGLRRLEDCRLGPCWGPAEPGAEPSY